MAGNVTEEKCVNTTENIDINFYRKVVRSYIDLHQYNAALFWADKVVSLSNGDADDVYWLAQCMFLLKQYHRAVHTIKNRGLERTHLLCHYLSVRCLLEARELTEALDLLNMSCQDIAISSTTLEVPVKEDQSNLHSSVLLLKGRVYEAMENRGLAADSYREALRSDVHCYEAFQALVQHHMLSAAEEQALLDSLPFSSQCSPAQERVLRLLYESQLKKYQAPQEVVAPGELLADNLDLAVSRAERHYYNCDYQKCAQLTEQILKQDPYHSSCLPVHIGCLVELNKSNKLFYLAHRLVDLYPDMAVSWFAVGCYYYVIGKRDPARRFLNKATSLDKLFGPAWLAYGHSFAADNEHDQAMAAYFKASQLMKGCHLPLLYIGLECGLTNNVKLANKFFLQAQSIAPQDPFVIHEMGVIAYQNHDYFTAERHFDDALKRVRSLKQQILADKWEPLFNNLGHTCRKLKKYPEALEYHRQALVLCPLNPSTYSAMGYVHALKGDTQEAVDAFHKALGIRRDDTFSTTMLSYVIEQLLEDSPPFPGTQPTLPTLLVSKSSAPQPLGTEPLNAQPSAMNIEHSPVALSNMSLSYEVEMLDSSFLG